MHRRDFNKSIAALFGAIAVPITIVDAIIAPAAAASEVRGYWGFQSMSINSITELSDMFDLGSIKPIEDVTKNWLESSIVVLSGDEPEPSTEYQINFVGEDGVWEAISDDAERFRAMGSSGRRFNRWADEETNMLHVAQDVDIFHAGTEKIADIRKLSKGNHVDIHLYISPMGASKVSFDSRENAQHKISLLNHKVENVEKFRLADKDAQTFIAASLALTEASQGPLGEFK